jgi:hypothetical protein
MDASGPNCASRLFEPSRPDQETPEAFVEQNSIMMEWHSIYVKMEHG